MSWQDFYLFTTAQKKNLYSCMYVCMYVSPMFYTQCNVFSNRICIQFSFTHNMVMPNRIQDIFVAVFYQALKLGYVCNIPIVWLQVNFCHSASAKMSMHLFSYAQVKICYAVLYNKQFVIQINQVILFIYCLQQT